MLIQIKPHSSLSSYFTGDTLLADLHTYKDVISYLRAMQPKFITYVKRLYNSQLQESYTLLDKNLKEISNEEMQMRRVREGDVIHIVPAIVGGGGKRGGILAAVALAAFVIFLPQLAPFLGGALGTGAAGAGAAGAGATAAAGSGLSASIAILKATPWLANLVTNVGLAILSSLFMPDPSSQQDSARQNDMFGSLQNTTTTGTPIALHYGTVRVAGQLISGYILSLQHDKVSTVNAYGDVKNAVVQTVEEAPAINPIERVVSDGL